MIKKKKERKKGEEEGKRGEKRSGEAVEELWRLGEREGLIIC